MDSIGIIGGSDGPTTFVVTSHWHWYDTAGIVLAIAVIAAIIIRIIIKRKRHM